MRISISAADVERAKKFAKQSKHSFPHLSHLKLLNYAAQQLFKARNYHELNQWRESTIQQYIISRGNIATCSYCGLTFGSHLKEERNLHRRHHDAFEEAVTILNYLPEHTSQQERRKEAGYNLLSNGTSTQERLGGALDVLRGWFDRSLVSAMSSGYWKQHPKFETYVTYMIGGLSQACFPQDVQNELKRRFGQVDGIIDKGHSYWYPPRKIAGSSPVYS